MVELALFLVVAGSAAYSLTRIVVESTIFAPIRADLEGLHPRLGELVRCRLCTGAWVSILLVVPFSFALLSGGELALGVVAGPFAALGVAELLRVNERGRY